jgi:hypothetical protein
MAAVEAKNRTLIPRASPIPGIEGRMMRGDILLTVAMVLSQHADPAPSPRPAVPPTPQPVPTAAPPAAAPKTSETTQPAPASAPERVVAFDAERAALDWAGGDWHLVADGATLKDFGRRESEGRQALRLIRELRLNQRGTIGGPTPSLEYWLSDGQAPARPPSGMRVLPIDAASLRVEQSQDQWVLRDDQRALFGFGRAESDAQQALAVIRRYGFTEVGTVGQASPSMMVFFGGQDLTAAPDGALGARLRPPEPPAPDAASPAGKRPAAVATFMTPAVPPLREGATAGVNASIAVQNPDRTPFDWRRVELRQENGAWKMAAGSCVLADFGTDEHAARLGLSAVQYYRFTEKCQVGGTAGRFTYFQTRGQPGHGTLFGVDSQAIQPDRLAVRQVDGRWAVCAGDRPLVDMGDSQDAANQVLDLIRLQKCDRLCRLGTEDGKGMMFLVRAR